MADGSNAMKQIKEFFGSDGKPVENTELIDFKKSDSDGFAQVRDGIMDGSLNY